MPRREDAPPEEFDLPVSGGVVTGAREIAE